MRILITFTYGVSLELWFTSGIIYRELELYKRLSQRKVNYSLLTYGDLKDLNYTPILGDIKVIPVKKYVTSKISHFKFLKSLILPIRLKHLFSRIDIIKTNQMEGNLIACIAKLLFRKKLIVRCGYEWLRTYRSNYKIKENKNYIKYVIRYIWMYMIEFISYKLADGIILTNKRDIQFIIKTFRLENKKEKIKLFYNFINTDLFRNLGTAKKDKTVLFIGRLTEEKNLFNLIKAFKGLNNFSLDIIGKGPLENNLKKKSKDLGVKVNFLGVYPNNKLPEIINQYQIYILPSYYEGNPKTLLEAMSCEVACIGTDVFGINNIIRHGINGFLCATNPESIKSAILEVYKDHELRDKIRKNARKFILDNCSLDSITEKEFQFYKSVLGEK